MNAIRYIAIAFWKVYLDLQNICSSDTEIQDGEYPERLVPTKVEIYPTKVSHACLPHTYLQM